jgi:hypothetical protein
MHHALHCTLPTHPRTGLHAVGIVKGRPVWPILGGEESADAAAQAAAAKAASDAAAKAAADAAYTPPGSQADLDRIIESRLARERAKFADYDDVKAKAAKHDALEAELASDGEKAVKAARDEESGKVRGEWAPRVVRAEFKAAAKGVLSKDQLDALLEDLDLSKYVTDKGDPDEDKIEKKIGAFSGNGGGSKTPLDLGQGNRKPAADDPGARGRAEAEKRYGKRTA